MSLGIIATSGTMAMQAEESDGLAFVYDPELPAKVNLAMLNQSEAPDKQGFLPLGRLVKEHVNFTGSTASQALLDDWGDKSANSVFPTDYKRVIAELEEAGIGWATGGGV